MPPAIYTYTAAAERPVRQLLPGRERRRRRGRRRQPARLRRPGLPRPPRRPAQAAARRPRHPRPPRSLQRRRRARPRAGRRPDLRHARGQGRHRRGGRAQARAVVADLRRRMAEGRPPTPTRSSTTARRSRIGGLRIRAHELGPCESASEALYVVEAPGRRRAGRLHRRPLLQRPPQLQRRRLHRAPGSTRSTARPPCWPASTRCTPVTGARPGPRRSTPSAATSSCCARRSATWPAAKPALSDAAKEQLTARMSAFLPDPALAWLVGPQRRRGRRRARRRGRRRRARESGLSRVRRVRPEVRHLAYFVALAEELNFTRAAARVNVVQQSLSAGVAQLEAHRRRPGSSSAPRAGCG